MCHFILSCLKKKSLSIARGDKTEREKQEEADTENIQDLGKQGEHLGMTRFQ